MARYSRIILDELKSRVDLADLITSYGVELKRSGVRLAGLCPFHSERSPSFSVNPSAGFFHCFGCGEGGDAFAFVQKTDNCSFNEAVLMLAHHSGYALPEVEETDEEKKAEEDRVRVYEILEYVSQWYHEQFMPLPTSHPAKAELNSDSRKLGTKELCEEFNIGYAPEGWDTLSTVLQEKGYSREHILLSGMGVEAKNGNLVDRFRGRVTWTIRDIRGRAVGFGARKLYDTDNGAKYINSPETIVYKKSRTLYNLDKARKAIVSKGKVYVVEGYTDIMACWDAGVHNVVASSGTAFGDEHISQLRRLLDGYGDGRTGQIIFCFDGDSAGQKAARKTLDLDTPLQARSYVITLPDSMDPCDYRAREGNTALYEALTDESQKTPLVDFVLSNEAQNHDITTANGRIGYLNTCLPILRKIREQELRMQAMRRVSYHSGVKIAQVEDFLRQENFSVDEQVQAVAVQPAPVREPMGLPQKLLLAMIMQYPETVAVCDQAGLSGEDFLIEDYQIAYYEALGYAHNSLTGQAQMSGYNNEDLMEELSTMDISPPSTSMIFTLVNSLKKYWDDSSRGDATRRLYGMTEEGYQGVSDSSFKAAQEVAELNLKRLEREEKESQIVQTLGSKKSRSKTLNKRLADETLDSILSQVKNKGE